MAVEPLIEPAPSGWRLTTLGEACAEGGGDIQTGPFGSQLHASDYVAGGIPSVMPQNIGENRINDEEIAGISASDTRRLQRYLLKAGDIVYSRRGDVERRALVRDHEEGWLCGTGCLRVRFGRGAVDPPFASYQLAHPEVRAWIVRHAIGATMPNLNTSILSALPFLVPPLDEQRAIAAILGALDDKIELNRRMNETLEAMASAIFKSWFVDFDPVRAKAEGRQLAGMDAEVTALFPPGFQESSLGAIPEGWQASIVGEEFRVTMGQSPPGETYNEVGEGIAFYQGRTDFGMRYPAARIYCTAPTRFAEAGDTLVSVRAPVGDVNLARERCCIGRGVAAVRHRSGSRSFTLHSITALRDSFLNFEGEGTVFGSISKADFARIKSVSPPELIVTAFERMAFPLDQSIELNDDESRTLTALRDALLPKLLSGEIRIDSSGSHL